MAANKINVVLTLNNLGVKKFKTTPTFKDLLHPNQLAAIVEGENQLTVNHTVWGSLQRVCGYDSKNMSVKKQTT